MQPTSSATNRDVEPICLFSLDEPACSVYARVFNACSGLRNKKFENLMPASHILLTGPPGIGKTTVIRKICDELKKQKLKVDGFFTEEVREGRERVGFDIVTLHGKRDILARISDAGSARRLPKVGKYSVHVPSFEKLALPIFECIDLDVLVLDEIGKMELFSKSFLSKAREAFSRSNSSILATIPIPKSPLPLVDDLRHQENCTLIQVTRENRNELPAKIVEQLLKS